MLGEIIRILEGIDEDIEISVDKNQISFSFDGVYLTSRVVDGSFPDYKNLIPKETTTEVIVLKQDFINNLKIANVFSDKFNKITMTVEPRNKKFELKTKNSDVGESLIG